MYFMTKKKDNIEEVKNVDFKESVDFEKKFAELSKDYDELSKKNEELNQKLEEREQQLNKLIKAKNTNKDIAFAYTINGTNNNGKIFTDNETGDSIVIVSDNKAKMEAQQNNLITGNLDEVKVVHLQDSKTFELNNKILKNQRIDQMLILEYNKKQVLVVKDFIEKSK